MAIARGELVSLPELAIPYVRARSAIFDAAIWRRYQDARAGIRKTGERMSVGARLALPIPPRLHAAEQVRDAIFAEARADFLRRLRDGSLQVWGQRDSIRGNWQLIGVEELSYLKAVRGVRDRWEGGGLCYYRLHVLDLVGVDPELAGRIYGPIELVQHIEKLERDPGVDWSPGQPKPRVYREGVSGRRSYEWDADGSAAGVPDDPEAVAAEHRRALAELQAWVALQLQSGQLVDGASAEDEERRIRPPFALPPRADDFCPQAAPDPIPQHNGASALVVASEPATPPFEEASDANVRKWFKERVATWPDDRPYPSERVDWKAFKGHFGPSSKRNNFRTARIDHTPREWRKQGPRKPRMKTR